MGQSRNVSLVEVVVVVLMLVFLLSMVDGLFPTKPHQSARRSVCAANLKGLGTALAMYAAQARGSFPLASTARMRDSGSPEKGLHARPDEGTVLMFDCGQSVTAESTGGLHRWQGVMDAAHKEGTWDRHVRIPGKDVRYAFPSRELYLLVKGNYAQAAQFVCPSTMHEADPMWADRPESASHSTDVTNVLHLQDITESVPASQLWDFLEPDTLDYGYMFAHDANGERANESMDPGYPMMADSNPYIRKGLYGGTIPPASNTQNTLNHLGEGQNVVFGDLHAQFFDKPTVGVGGDNIYTAWYSRPGKKPTRFFAEVLAEVTGEAPRVVAGPTGEPASNYLFDIVSKTDAMLLP